MSKLIALVHAWPELEKGSESSGGTGLPLPLRAYAASPRNATLAGDLNNAHIARRSRFKTSYSTLNVQFTFTVEQYDLFKNFFFQTLGNGCAQFRIALRYPENSAVKYWNVRFVSDYSADWLDGRWGVTAQIDLIRESYTADISALYGYQEYDVLIDDSSGADSDQAYMTKENRIYLVKEA